MAAEPQDIKPGNLLKADRWEFLYRQRSNPHNSNLEWLSFGTYHVAPGAMSDELYHRTDEALLFCMKGPVEIVVDTHTFNAGYYDTLYVPRETPYRIRNSSSESAELVLCHAPAENKHPVHFSEWEKIRADESRIRHLDGKDVFLMFDVSEPADKLLAGYTIYEPHARAWPPHNHTDQEEIYIFSKGRGAMEIYSDEKNKTFVYSMDTMDAATIPLLNYHPVFSQDEELHFIWCLAGERYWVGDKHKEFMDASVDNLTT